MKPTGNGYGVGCEEEGTGAVFQYSNTPPLHHSVPPNSRTRTTTSTSTMRLATRSLNGCNLPREVVRLAKAGTSTGRRLARSIPPDSPTEGLGPSDSVPAGHRYQSFRDARFSGAGESSRPHSEATGAIERKRCLALFPADAVEIDNHDNQTAGNDSLPEGIDVHQVRAIGDSGQNEGTKQWSMHRTDGTEQTCAANH